MKPKVTSAVKITIYTQSLQKYESERGVVATMFRWDSYVKIYVPMAPFTKTASIYFQAL